VANTAGGRFFGDFEVGQVLRRAARPVGRDQDRPCGDFPLREGEGYAANVVLDFDIWVLPPR